jgi:hypothetical protein
MKGIRRRQFFGTAGAVVGGTVFGTVARAESPGAGRSLLSPPQESRFRALVAVRYLNTVQANRGSAPSLGYLPLEEIPSSLFSTRNGMPSFLSPESFRGSGEMVPGYLPVFDLGVEGQGYRFMLVHSESGFAYWTDQNGVIFEGFVPSRKTGEMPTIETFVGTPIRRPEDRFASFMSSRMRGAFGALLSLVFLLPRGDRCSESSCGTCWGNGTPCGGSGSCSQETHCCNTGFENCTWCCVASGKDCSCVGGDPE